MQDLTIGGGAPGKIMAGPQPMLDLDADLQLELDQEDAKGSVGTGWDEVKVSASAPQETPPPRKVDLQGALAAAVSAVVPGATVAFLAADALGITGENKLSPRAEVEAVNVILKAMESLPPALAQAAKGMEVLFLPSMWRAWGGDGAASAKARSRKKEQEDSEVALLQSQRMMAMLKLGQVGIDPKEKRLIIPPEVLALPPGPDGQSTAEKAVLEAILRLVGGEAGATGRFAQATGWQQQVLSPDGTPLGPVGPADGREAGTLALVAMEDAGLLQEGPAGGPDAPKGGAGPRPNGLPALGGTGKLGPQGMPGANGLLKANALPSVNGNPVRGHAGPEGQGHPVGQAGATPLGGANHPQARGPVARGPNPIPTGRNPQGSVQVNERQLGPQGSGRPGERQGQQGTGKLNEAQTGPQGTGSLNERQGGPQGTGNLAEGPRALNGNPGRGPVGDRPGTGNLRGEGGPLRPNGQPGRLGTGQLDRGPGPRAEGNIEGLSIPEGPVGRGPVGPRSASVVLEEAAPQATSNGVRIPIIRGGEVVALVAFTADPQGGSVAGGQGIDPGSDFGASMATFLQNPKQLMAQDPARFLMLNAETRKFAPQAVAAMARELGVNLSSALGDMVAQGRLSPNELDRVSRANGVAPDAGRLEAADAKALAKAGTTVAGLVERLALDLSVRGAGTGAQVARAKELASEHLALAGGAKLQREVGAFGLVGRISSWLVTQAPEGTQAPALGRANMVAFKALPLAAQLRADPALALGAAWATLSGPERAQLRSPEGLKAILASAAGKSDQLSYIPQTLTVGEQRALGFKTVMSALVEPSGPGEALRKALAGEPASPGKPPADPKAVLESIKARNGQSAWALLPETDRVALLSPEGKKALKSAIGSPEWAEARTLVAQGGLGAEGLRTRLLKEVLKPVAAGEGITAAITRLNGAAVAERKAFVAEGGPPLELAMAALRRQVTDGAPGFARQLAAARTEGEVASLVGPWVWGALKSEEKKALQDADVRRMVVEESQAYRASGKSLAEAARNFHEATGKIQATLDLLLQPDQQFRLEFAKDPVAALQKRGMWKYMPEPLQAALEDPAKRPGLAAVTEAVQQVVVPMLAKKDADAQRRSNNLKRAMGGVNAGNYRPLLGLLRLGQADLHRHVRAGLLRAMDEDEAPVKGAPIRFV